MQRCCKRLPLATSPQINIGRKHDGNCNAQCRSFKQFLGQPVTTRIHFATGVWFGRRRVRAKHREQPCVIVRRCFPAAHCEHGNEHVTLRCRCGHRLERPESCGESRRYGAYWDGELCLQLYFKSMQEWRDYSTNLSQRDAVLLRHDILREPKG